MDDNSNSKDPPSNKNIGPCKVCGTVATTVCFGVPMCTECRKFFQDNRKNTSLGQCTNQMRCFIGKTKQGYWNETSNCKPCRFTRMVYLGMMELQGMKGLPKPTVSSTPSNNVAGPITSSSAKTLTPIPSEFVARSAAGCSAPRKAPAPSSNNGSTHRSPVTSRRCQICCNDKQVGNAYGARQICLTCTQCFARCWKDENKLPIQCLLNRGNIGECETSRYNPPICRFCRLKKCIELGMKCTIPLTFGSAVYEVMQILEGDVFDQPDVVDGPRLEEEEPLFAAKPEMMSPEYGFPSPSTSMVSPVRTDADNDTKMNSSAPMCSTSSHQPFVPLRYSFEHLCTVCITYPIIDTGKKFCAPCHMFFEYASRSVGVFKSACYAKDCDLKGDPSRCSLCRLLKCLRFGMSVPPDTILRGSPLHRAMLQAKNSIIPWQWTGRVKPKQILPRFLEDVTNFIQDDLIDEDKMCAVGKRFSEELVEAAQGIRVCTKCMAFFTNCNSERSLMQAVCENSGKCPIYCVKAPCVPCKLIRCLEVGMCAPWKQGTHFYNVVKSWRPQTPPSVERVPNVCTCGRVIEATATGETCMECTSESLIQFVKNKVANGEEKGETHFEMLQKAGLAERVEKRRSPYKERTPFNSENEPASVNPILPSEEIIPIEIIRVGAIQEQAAPVANGHRSPAYQPAETSPSRNLNTNEENGHQPLQRLEANGLNRKRKAPLTRKSFGPGSVTCQVCSIEFTLKQTAYDCLACTSCSTFFHRCFTEEEENFFCPRKKGADPCNIQQTTWQHRAVKPCGWCRLVKWISLSPRLPSAPLKGTPIHQMVFQEQVAVLTDENEFRRGSYRLEPIEDNLKLSASRTFQLVKSPGQRTDFVSSDEEGEEGSTGSAISGSSRENRHSTKSSEHPSISWKNLDEKAPCSICGTLRRARDKNLGAPACSKCIALINGCWTNVNGPVMCLQLNGEPGKCNLSWKYRQCVYCQLMKAVSVGCVPTKKAVRGSMGEIIVEEYRKYVAENAAPEKDTSDEDDEIDDDADSSKRARWSEECVGCGSDNTQMHYGVRMCPSCHSFFRHSMKTNATFSPCHCLNNTIGRCPIDVNFGLKNCCGYCRLKKLLIAPGISLCKENIESTPVKLMIDLEKIPVIYVSGGSYATKSSMRQVLTEKCQVCTHFQATSHFHGVFLCKKCRTFISKQWVNRNDVYCLNPDDRSKCTNLVAQQCGLCRILKCIEVGARNNGPLPEDSFIARLCPGYPQKRELDEQVFKSIFESSYCRQLSISSPNTIERLKGLGELPPLIDFKMEVPERSPVNEENGRVENGAINGLDNGELEREIGAMMIGQVKERETVEDEEEGEETMEIEAEPEGESADVFQELSKEGRIEEEVKKDEDDVLLLDHVFDNKNVPQKCSEFLDCFGEMLFSVECTSMKGDLGKMNQLDGWNTFLAALEPLFDALCKWADTLRWLALFDDVNREQILRDSCVEAAVLVTCQMMRRFNGCIPYGTDQVLAFEDLQSLLRSSECTKELAALDKFYECFNLMEEISFIRRDLALVMNVILVKRTGYDRKVLDEYFKQIEEMLLCESLEEEAPMDKVRTLIDSILDTGDLIRSALMKLFSSLPLSFPPLTKRFFCSTD